MPLLGQEGSRRKARTSKTSQKKSESFVPLDTLNEYSDDFIYSMSVFNSVLAQENLDFVLAGRDLLDNLLFGIHNNSNLIFQINSGFIDSHYFEEVIPEKLDSHGLRIQYHSQSHPNFKFNITRKGKRVMSCVVDPVGHIGFPYYSVKNALHQLFHLYLNKDRLYLADYLYNSIYKKIPLDIPLDSVTYSRYSSKMSLVKPDTPNTLTFNKYRTSDDFNYTTASSLNGWIGGATATNIDIAEIAPPVGIAEYPDSEPLT